MQPIKFIKSWKGYRVGEVAGFLPARTKELLEGGYAEIYGRTLAPIGGAVGTSPVTTSVQADSLDDLPWAELMRLASEIARNREELVVEAAGGRDAHSLRSYIRTNKD